MLEYDAGFEHIREPDGLLPEGEIVTTHKHNFHHNTHLIMGLWEVHRYVPIVGADGKQRTQRVSKPFSETDGNGVLRTFQIEEDELLWHEMPLMTIQGGGPRSIVPIPANMMHKFVLKKGWGFYRCVFAHRDADGNYCEVTQHYAHSYV